MLFRQMEMTPGGSMRDSGSNVDQDHESRLAPLVPLFLFPFIFLLLFFPLHFLLLLFLSFPPFKRYFGSFSYQIRMNSIDLPVTFRGKKAVLLGGYM